MFIRTSPFCETVRDGAGLMLEFTVLDGIALLWATGATTFLVVVVVAAVVVVVVVAVVVVVGAAVVVG